MKKLSPLLRQSIVFITIFLLLKVMLKVILGVILNSLGWSPLPVEQFIAENELGVQIFSLLLAFTCMILIERKYGFSCHAVTRVLRFHLTLDQVLTSMLYGFLSCSIVVGVGVLLGFAQIESPSADYFGLFRLLPWMLLQGAYFLLWVSIIELLRWEFFYSLTKSNLPKVFSFLFATIFESHLLYSLAQSNSNLTLGFVSIIFCLLLSAAMNVTFLLSLKKQKVIGDIYYLRVIFLSSLGFSFMHVYGQNIASWRGASILQLYEGPLGVAPVVFYSIVVLIVANTALQKLLKHGAKHA